MPPYLSALFTYFWFTLLLGLTVIVHSAEPRHYFDEDARRFITLESGDLGNTRVTVRFAISPGSVQQWVGQGQSTEKELVFSRIVEGEEAAGSQFIAKVSESRIEVGYKPQQTKSEDAGINGIYRRVNESKLLQLAKKEYQAAEERLELSFRNASKVWDSRDRPTLILWKNLWPEHRRRWMNIVNLTTSKSSDGTKNEQPASQSSAKTAKDWIYAAQVMAKGYSFIEGIPDPKTSTGWEGEYDDLGGGHASLRLAEDGRLQVSLSNYRIAGDGHAIIEGTVPANLITKSQTGELKASFTASKRLGDEASDKQAHVKLTKIGRYLVIETENASSYANRAWFDGIYRGSPSSTP